MRLLKSHPILGLVNSYLVDSPQPSNISYMWNFGSLLGACLIIQILTGVFLAMHYTPSVDLAFISVEHIMRDVNYGWLIRYLHANTASFFFIFVYLHIGRGLYYGSYKSPRTLLWSIGVIILVLMMAIAFLGYVLPYGQMSLWGATVITNLLSAIPWIGQDFVEFVKLLLFIITLSIFYYYFTTEHNYNMTTIGKVNESALRGKKSRTDQDKKAFLSSISYDFMSIFIGLIDGDGYIAITKIGLDNIRMELVLSVDIKDLKLLQHIKNVLKIGRINQYPNINTAKLIIGKVDLQEVLFPLILHYKLFFLTDTRRKQFNLCMYLLQNNITKFSLIPSIDTIKDLFTLPKSSIGYVNLPFFYNWIVGFTIAEGSFYIKSSGEHFFSLRQRSHPTLFEAFKLVFKTNRKIEDDGKHIKFSVSSTKDLINVVTFFSNSGLHSLLGLKADQYNAWLISLK